MRRQRILRGVVCYTLIAGVLIMTVLPAAELRFAKREGMFLNTNASSVVAAALSPPLLAPADGSAPPAYRSLIHEIATRHGQPPELVESIIRVESNFNPRAVSRKGARGLMQLMPETASRLGVRNIFDARENIEGGVRHLRYLFARFSGDVQLTLAAYNAGEETVKRHQGIPPYAETRAYVERVLELSGWLDARSLAWAPEAVAASVPGPGRRYRH